MHDMDRTLITLRGNPDYIETFADIFRQLVKEMGGTDVSGWKKRELYPAIGLPHDDSVVYMQERLGIDDTEAFWKELEERDFEARKPVIGNGIKLYPDAERYLETLVDGEIKMGIITNTPMSIAEMQLEKLGVSGVFHDIFAFRYNESNSKPMPWAIEEMIKRHGLSPESVWIFGDSESDILTGRNAGIRTGQVIREDCQDLSIHNKDEPDIKGETLTELFEKAKSYEG